jgi:large subunit ribosomal protein L17
MVRNMVVSLFRHERIRTTVPKAKLVRPWAERMITLGKKGTLHARRLAYAFLRSKPAVAKLFRTLGPRFMDRPGGYTRIMKLAEAMRPAGSDKFDDSKTVGGFRIGDGTPLAIIELVEAEVQPKEKRRRRATPEPFRPRREDYGKSKRGEKPEEAKATAVEDGQDGQAPAQ